MNAQEKRILDASPATSAAAGMEKRFLIIGGNAATSIKSQIYMPRELGENLRL